MLQLSDKQEVNHIIFQNNSDTFLMILYKGRVWMAQVS